MNVPIRAIFLDFDGVVVDGEQSRFNFLKAELLRHDVILTKDFISQTSGQTT